MNLFIETPEREAERRARERRPASELRAGAGSADGAMALNAPAYGQLGSDNSIYDAARFAPMPAQAPPARADAFATRQMPSQTGPMPRWMIEARAQGVAASPPSTGPYEDARYGGAAARRGAAAGPYGGQGGGDPLGERYYPGPAAYQEEMAYNRSRAQRRRRAGVLRVLLLVIAVPLMLVIAFVVSYILTCILNGASPDDIAGLLADLADRVRTWVADLHLFEQA